MNRPRNGSILKLLDARRPVAFFYNGFGDHLLTLPAIRALAALFPNRLRLVCVPSAATSFFATVAVQSFVETEIWRINGVRHFSADVLATRIGRCDLFISLAPWHVDAIDLLLSLIGPTHSIGFSPAFDDVLLNDARRHSADVAFGVPRWLEENLRIEEFSAPPPLPTEATLAAMSIRDSLPARARVLVIHADTGCDKMWGIQKWRMFLDFVLNRYETFVIFVVGLSTAIVDEGWPKDRVFGFHGYSLPASFALISVADLFVGIDSCMLHAADLFRVPGVGLFGPTRAEKWGFRFGAGRHVQGDGTMESITVEQVICAFGKLVNDLEESSQDRASHKHLCV
jgi:ADP-heptose:LPS heptosyltransferase